MKKTSLLFSFLFLFVSFGWSQIRLPKLISDGAILQRDAEIKIWGWASPNESIELHFKNKIQHTEADSEGNWYFILGPQMAGGPFEMEFVGNNKITLRNILFGDVWLCSGQSNMELTMQRLKDQYPNVILNSNNPDIRQFLVPDRYDFIKVQKDFEEGSWKEANPENILEFSGVGYFFALDLHKKYKVPIGLINAALGGSPVEAWMSEEALKPFPEAYKEHQKYKDLTLIAEIEAKDEARQKSWYTELRAKDEGMTQNSEWFLDNTDDKGWKEMQVPGYWADQGLDSINGSVWFRKHLDVPAQMSGNEAKLWLGRIVDQDYVYFNGVLVGGTGYQYPPRKYIIADSLLKKGRNTITVRVINKQGQGGFILDKPYFLSVANDTLDLKGNWKYKLGTEMKPLEGPTFIRWKPGGLYNAMISPLIDYKIKGVIWYQGESNTQNPREYFNTFPALIKDWRQQFQIGNFPFLYVQLANFMEPADEPVESNWASLRQAQLEALTEPNTGMVVTIDLGEWNDIHPLNKMDVGKRLAQQAQKLAYMETKSSLNPIPINYQFLKTKVKIEFSEAKGGLISNNGAPLKYFEISMNGKDFVKARATIEGNMVIVDSEKVTNPTVVRYAWANNPVSANLYSKSGLPATPFEIKKE
ncbi:sialate O-acetylesterase [Eudoraea sp.]|uniref:sialate O-acetylesterase n=1 Tax=Eudoraea sp. TaxID=1979955 RepID=UPI003C708A67